jgi:predicted PurR-regulated permease PerM
MVVVSMFGGLLVVGTVGTLLGPLLARLAREGLVLLREERDRADEASEPGRRSEHGEHLDQSLEPH